jgi:hypothetical protein
MSLRQSVALYDMRSDRSSRLKDILQFSRNADKVMIVATVCTDQVSRVQEDPKYLELWISFYAGVTAADREENQPPKLDVKMVVPQGWTPKMYLATLNKSIRRHSILSLESITLEGRIYATVNELQWLFSATEEATYSDLICLASYIHVSGGVLKKV